MSADERILGVIEAVYAAAADSSLWPPALAALAAYTGSATDRADLAALEPHVARAQALSRELATLRALNAWLTSLIDQNPAAIVLLDRNLQVLHLNAAATTLFSARDGIALNSDGVALARKRDRERLAELIEQALANSPAGGTMNAARRSRRHAYRILVAPVTNPPQDIAVAQPALCIVIHDPEAEIPLAGGYLRATYGLTESEAALAMMLARGQTLKTSAAMLGITYGTARTRLSQIFQKTQTRRQSELIRLLLTSYRGSD